MRWVESVVLKARLSKVLKNTCKDKYICPEIKDMIIPERFEAKGFPHLSCVLVVFVRGTFVIDNAKESGLWGKLCLTELLERALIVIRVNTFTLDEGEKRFALKML